MVVPVIVLLAIVTLGSVNVPVLVIAPELIVPVVEKLPLDWVKFPVCVNVPVIPTAAKVLVPVTVNVPAIVALPETANVLLGTVTEPDPFAIKFKLLFVPVLVTVFPLTVNPVVLNVVPYKLFHNNRAVPMLY